MISPARNELLQGILTTIFLTATAIEFVEASSRCKNFGVDCTCEQRPPSCPDELPCCRYKPDLGHITYCLRDSSYCPPGSYRCSDTYDVPFCMHGGICCKFGNNSFCICPEEFDGLYCQIRTYTFDGEKRSVDAASNSPCTSTTEQRNSRVYTTRRSLAETTTEDEMSALRESRTQPPAMSIGLTTFVVIIAVAVLLCIGSVFIARLVFKRKNDSVANGIKSGSTDAEKKYQNLKASQLNEDGEIADHYDTLELYDKGYETIDEYSLEDPNYAAIQDDDYLQVMGETADDGNMEEADDGNMEEADDNDYATTEIHLSEQTEANVGYQALLVQETPCIQ